MFKKYVDKPNFKDKEQTFRIRKSFYRIERETEELFFKPIIVSIDDTDKFEQKEMKKRPVKNTWHDRLINYIPEPLRKSAGGFKDKILSFFKDKHT